MSSSKKAIARKRPKFGYSVRLDSRCIESNSEGSSSAYGYTESVWEHTFKDICPGGEWPSVASSLQILPGEHTYVVWLAYTEGDSMGESVNGSVQILGVFKDETAANQLALALEASEGRTSNFTVKTKDGQSIDIYPHWSGWFNSLGPVHIDSALMGIGELKESEVSI